MLVFLFGCQKREQKNFGVKFSDDAFVYTNTFKDAINSSYIFPEGIPVLIKTVDSIPISQIGSIATLCLQNDSNWFAWGEFKDLTDNGLLILVSKVPKMVQVRFGKKLSLEAYKAGLVIGPKYNELQQKFLENNYSNGLEKVLSILQVELPKALNLPWLIKLLKPAPEFIYDELSELSMPSENAYTNYIFKPYSHFLSTFGLFKYPLIFVIFNALLLFVIVKMGIYIIKKIFSIWKKMCVILLFIWSLLSSVLFSIPFWGAVIFLSSFRTEDRMFAQYLNIPLPLLNGNFNFYTSFTPFWLALILGVFILVIVFPKYINTAMGIDWLLGSDSTSFKNSLNRVIENDSQELVGHTIRFALRYMIMALFMPRIITLLILFYYLIQLPSAIMDYIKFSKA
jgi:hypothetical protein